MDRQPGWFQFIRGMTLAVLTFVQGDRPQDNLSGIYIDREVEG